MAEEEIEFQEEEGYVPLPKKKKKSTSVWNDEPVIDDIIWTE